MELNFDRAEHVLGAPLTSGQRAALAALVVSRGHHDRPTRQPAWLRLAGLGSDHAEAVTELRSLDLVALWEHDGLGHPLASGPRITLTPWGAWVLGVELVEDVDEFPYWDTAEAPDGPRPRRGIRVPRAPGEYGIPLPDLLVDPASIDEPAYLIDEWSGTPMHLLGAEVVIDRRIKAKPKAKKGGKGPRRVA